jgi:hypothetical protein
MIGFGLTPTFFVLMYGTLFTLTLISLYLGTRKYHSEVKTYSILGAILFLVALGIFAWVRGPGKEAPKPYIPSEVSP